MVRTSGNLRACSCNHNRMLFVTMVSCVAMDVFCWFSRVQSSIASRAPHRSLPRTPREAWKPTLWLGGKQATGASNPHIEPLKLGAVSLPALFICEATPKIYTHHHRHHHHPYWNLLKLTTLSQSSLSLLPPPLSIIAHHHF